MKTILALVVLLGGLNAFAENVSVYTGIAKADCKTIQDSEKQKNPEIDSYSGVCPGHAGYEVIISGWDLRYSLALKYAGKVINLTSIMGFHDMGSKKVEWRGPAASDRFNSLIYRLKIQDPDGDRMTDSLYVVRLAGRKSCVIGIVPQGPNMNLDARAIADSPGMACLPKGE